MVKLSFLRNNWTSTRPILVHGFIGRMAAERRLRQSKPGTFLLRFSESKNGALVVSFTEHVSTLDAFRVSHRTTGGGVIAFGRGLFRLERHRHAEGVDSRSAFLGCCRFQFQYLLPAGADVAQVRSFVFGYIEKFGGQDVH